MRPAHPPASTEGPAPSRSSLPPGLLAAAGAGLAAGILAGLAAGGSGVRQLLVGAAVVLLTAVAWTVPRWHATRELRRLRHLDEAVTEFVAALSEDDAPAARTAAVEALQSSRTVGDDVRDAEHLLVRLAPQLVADEVAPADDVDDLRRLIACAAHDLRTPLNTLTGMVDTLIRHGEDLDAARRERLYGALQRSTRRIAGWTTMLLDAAVGERPRPESVTPGPLEPLLDEAVTVSAAATAGLAVRVVSTDAWVQADPGAVVRVISNLLANVGHHAHAGDVEIEARARQQWVQVSVRDDGEGWQRVPGLDTVGRGESSPGHAGFGLGLASVRSRVAAWGGQLELDETPGGGATVRFTVPRAPSSAREEATHDGGWTITGEEWLLRRVRRRP